MDTFFEHAQQLLETARSAECGSTTDFGLIIRPDGGLHFLMETPFSLTAAAADGGARSAYRVTRSETGIRVEGWSHGRKCAMEESNEAGNRAPAPILPDQRFYLPDQRLYMMTSYDSGVADPAV